MTSPAPADIARSRVLRRVFLAGLALVLGSVRPASAHDIPNARVDRSIQATVSPGKLTVVYEVTLSELTLTQELRTLIGQLPGAGRAEWFEAYGRETAPLNAKGFLASVDGDELVLAPAGFQVKVEEHPIYRFRFEAAIPRAGHLRVRDLNFESSEGTSRLGLNAVGVKLTGDYPGDVSSVKVRPVWQLSDEEERRSRGFEVDYETGGALAEQEPSDSASSPKAIGSSVPPALTGLNGLLDRAGRTPYVLLGLIAFGLGAVHSLQPGHGKTIVLAAAAADAGWVQLGLLAALTTLVHLSSVVLIALGLWWTTSERFESVHVWLARVSGYLIASVGFWRLGRALGGVPEVHDHGGNIRPGRWVALGIAGGLVPCWDAVGLVLFGSAVGRLGLVLLLSAAFSLGLGASLAALGVLALRLRKYALFRAEGGAWVGRLRVASGFILAVMGLSLLTLNRWL